METGVSTGNIPYERKTFVQISAILNWRGGKAGGGGSDLPCPKKQSRFPGRSATPRQELSVEPHCITTLYALQLLLSHLTMPYTRVAAVTGANKGIGFAIVRNLALQYPRSTFNNGPILIYLTARDKRRGKEALEAIGNDARLREAKVLAKDGGVVDVQYHPLDIADAGSIQSFAELLKKEHAQGIDFVINNAGIAMIGVDSNAANNTLATNYYGTLRATQTFLPLIKHGGRLINIASTTGKLNRYPPAIRERFLSAKSIADITALMEDFRKSVAMGTEAEDGWPRAAYAAYTVSKAGIIGFTRAIAQEEAEKENGILINSCCPGYVNTDMTRGKGVKTPDEGAQTPVLLALGDIGDRDGLFWEDGKPSQW